MHGNVTIERKNYVKAEIWFIELFFSKKELLVGMKTYLAIKWVDQPSKFIFFLSGHLAIDCSSLVASEKF